MVIFVLLTTTVFIQDLEIDDNLTTFIFPWLVDEVPTNQKWIGLGRSLLF